MKTFLTMVKTELKLSIRDMNMILFAIIMPVVVMFIIGVINGGKEAFPGAGYSFMEQSFGALCTISICASGVMGFPIMISDYRERKILKRFFVTPISPCMLIGVHIAIYAAYSLLSMLLLWGFAFVAYGVSIKGSILLFLLCWLLVFVSIMSIGMFVGGIAKNSEQASMIACVLYFPMLIFSGATLPFEVMPKVLQKIVQIMPLTQGISILKTASLGLPLTNMLVSVIILVAITILFTGLTIRFFKWE